MLRMSPTPPLRYPYEEFADHIKAMPLVQRWEYTARFGHVGNAQTSRAHISRVVEYFADCYEEPKEAVWKADVFLSVYDYLGRHAAFFAKKGLLEELESGTLSAEPALLRAVHYVFTAASQPGSVHPKKVLLLARAYKEVEPAG